MMIHYMITLIKPNVYPRVSRVLSLRVRADDRRRPVRLNHPPHHSSSSCGGNPHGKSIFCVKSYFTRPMLSPFATAKYDTIG